MDRKQSDARNEAIRALDLAVRQCRAYVAEYPDGCMNVIPTLEHARYLFERATAPGDP